MTNESINILRRPQVQSKTGLCRSAIYQMMGENSFPQSVQIGPRSVGWIESEVDQWLREQISKSRKSA